MSTVSRILTEEHYQQLKNAQDAAQAIQVEIDLATRAGFPVADMVKQFQDAQSRIAQIKNVYFPGR